MFNGLIRHCVPMLSYEHKDGRTLLTLQCPQAWHDLRAGESIAVNGCCLTLLTCDPAHLCFELGQETQQRTCFARLQKGQKVHVERALQIGDRLDGHWVTGHIDGCVHVHTLVKHPDHWMLQCRLAEPALSAWVAPQGSITLHGVALTVVDCIVEEGLFRVMLLPYTIEQTVFQDLCEGDLLHVEWDLLMRYVRHAHHVNRLLAEPVKASTDHHTH